MLHDRGGLGEAALGGGGEEGSDSSSFQGLIYIFILRFFLLPGCPCDLEACVSGAVLHGRQLHELQGWQGQSCVQHTSHQDRVGAQVGQERHNFLRWGRVDFVAHLFSLLIFFIIRNARW